MPNLPEPQTPYGDETPQTPNEYGLPQTPYGHEHPGAPAMYPQPASVQSQAIAPEALQSEKPIPRDYSNVPFKEWREIKYQRTSVWQGSKEEWARDVAESRARNNRTSAAELTLEQYAQTKRKSPAEVEGEYLAFRGDYSKSTLRQWRDAKHPDWGSGRRGEQKEWKADVKESRIQAALAARYIKSQQLAGPDHFVGQGYGQQPSVDLQQQVPVFGQEPSVYPPQNANAEYQYEQAPSFFSPPPMQPLSPQQPSPEYGAQAYPQQDMLGYGALPDNSFAALDQTVQRFPVGAYDPSAVHLQDQSPYAVNPVAEAALHLLPAQEGFQYQFQPSQLAPQGQDFHAYNAYQQQGFPQGNPGHMRRPSSRG